MSRCARRALAALSWLFVSGCGTEVGRVNLLAKEKHEITISLEKAGEIHFNSNQTYLRGSSSSPYLGEWAHTIDVVKNETASTTLTCDPLDVSMTASASQSCKGGRANCTEKTSGARISNCALQLPAGATTLRFSVTAKDPNSAPQLQELTLLVMQ